MADVLFLTTDLMFSSQVLGAAGALGQKLQLVASPADVAGKTTPDCRLALVDLTIAGPDLGGVVAAIRGVAPAARIVAFGPHVDEARLAAAQAAGCDLVLSRGQFHKQYAELLRAIS
ncbi:MAG: hypothetical protein SFU86_12045 [Pirellulaceae bacterium]|nr:hypothetical protein [Pirellulaceae bacterium]